MTKEEARELLGVDPDASEEDILGAFRRRSKEVYPGFANGDRDHWERLREARATLLDEPLGSEDLVPLRVALEITKIAEKGLARVDERLERAAESESALRSVVLSI